MNSKPANNFAARERGAIREMKPRMIAGDHFQEVLL
jgi:hypothetical protein